MDGAYSTHKRNKKDKESESKYLKGMDHFEILANMREYDENKS
jgi:hypothetical protein